MAEGRRPTPRPKGVPPMGGGQMRSAITPTGTSYWEHTS